VKDGLLFKFINERVEDFDEPRFMGPHPEGLSTQKFLASHYTGLTNWELEEVAKKVKTSLPLVRKWRGEEAFKKQENENVAEFVSYWAMLLQRMLDKKLDSILDIDLLHSEYKLYSFNVRAEIGRKLDELGDVYKTFPFLKGMAQKFLNRHVFLTSGDLRRRDTTRIPKEPKEKTMLKIEENIDRTIDFIVATVKTEEERKPLFDALYWLVINVTKLYAN